MRRGHVSFAMFTARLNLDNLRFPELIMLAPDQKMNVLQAVAYSKLKGVTRLMVLPELRLGTIVYVDRQGRLMRVS